MADSAGTSDENHPYYELIQQFKEICAVDDQVAQICIEQADGNLQNAINRFLSTGPSDEAEAPEPFSEVRRRRPPAPSPPQSVEVDTTSSSVSSTTSSPTPLTVNRRPEDENSWTVWFGRIFSMPVFFFYHSIRQIFVFVFGLFGGFLPAMTSPEEDAQNFREEIETKYSDVTEQLPWTHVPYSNALDQARAAVRFLVVYLHNPTHEKTNEFVRNTLCTSTFKNFLDNNRTLLWGTNIRTKEGHMVTQALRITNFPCVALICMRERSLACVARVSGIISVDPLIQDLQRGIDANQRFLNKILNERAQREMDNRLRREQEEEYMKALAIDRRKLAERRRLESEKIESQQREAEEQQEPNSDFVRVSIRFPSGGKFDRKFSEDDTLELLFKIVLVHEKCPEDFTLLSSYPRKELNCAPDWYKEFGTVEDGNLPGQTFKEAGLVSSVVILVRDNEA
ncbi:hypothetical protein FO519_006642 [Halicephalobus sp. NKZ332]|nr:hypothetical protein FO519_006642 [Halicephalobus sp. NKZ332]